MGDMRGPTRCWSRFKILIKNAIIQIKLYAEIKTNKIPVNSRVRQRDTIGMPKLFTSALENILKNLLE